MERLRQTTTVADYYASFMKEAPLTGYNDTALVNQFYRGLKESIKDTMVNIQRPDTLATMLQAALRFEGRILARMKEWGGFIRKPPLGSSKQYEWNLKNALNTSKKADALPVMKWAIWPETAQRKEPQPRLT